MANKIKIIYRIDLSDEKARLTIEKTLKSLMDWIQITDNEWIVLANRHTAASLRDKIQKNFQSQNSRIETHDLKKTKIGNEGYIDAKNGEASEVLFTSKF